MTVEVKPLNHINVKKINEALSLLKQYKEKAKIIAGGTDVVRLMKNKVIAPDVLINIKTVPGLIYIKEDKEGLKIGALTTIRDIEKSPIIRDKYSVLAEAAYSVAAPQLKNMGTIVGNLCQDVQCLYYRRPPITGKSFFCRRKGGKICYAIAGQNIDHAILGGNKCFGVCPSDMATALIALNAKIKIAGPDGEKTISLENFYTVLGNILESNQIITEIQVPALKHDTKQRYLKFRLRKTIDFAISSVAAAIMMEGGVISSARIVLGGVSPIPYRATSAEEILIGKSITENAAMMSSKAAVSTAKPLSMNAYKVPITEVLVKRAILGCL